MLRWLSMTCQEKLQGGHSKRLEGQICTLHNVLLCHYGWHKFGKYENQRNRLEVLPFIIFFVCQDLQSLLYICFFHYNSLFSILFLGFEIMPLIFMSLLHLFAWKICLWYILQLDMCVCTAKNSDFAMADDAVVINLSDMNSVTVDVEKKVCVVIILLH